MAIMQKTIVLTEVEADWIAQQVIASNCSDESEYIRSLIQAEQERAGETDVLRAALNEGEESGDAGPFDIEEFRRQMAARNA